MQNPNEVWLQSVKDVINHGDKVSPRGIPVHEIIARQTVIYMDNPVLNIPERKLGHKFMAAEAWWILTGRKDVEFISKYSKEISKFSDNGETFFGAYGPKIVDQIPFIINTLGRDRDTRQAVINIWRESPYPSKDIPCTLSAQFLIRDDKLHVVNTMRSSDLWLGWPYDVFSFSVLSYMIILYLRNNFGIRLTPGKLYLTAGSSHVYDKNIEPINFILNDFLEDSSWSKIELGFFKSTAEMLSSLRGHCDIEGGALTWLRHYSVSDR